MNFEPMFRQLRETAALIAEIEQSQTAAQKAQAENVVQRRESMHLHEQLMAHIDRRLSSMTLKLGLMAFNGPQ